MALQQERHFHLFYSEIFLKYTEFKHILLTFMKNSTLYYSIHVDDDIAKDQNVSKIKSK